MQLPVVSLFSVSPLQDSTLEFSPAGHLADGPNFRLGARHADGPNNIGDLKRLWKCKFTNFYQ